MIKTMMSQAQLVILHGENQTKSREQLVELINQLKTKHFQIARLNAKDLSVAKLEEALGSDTLFDTGQALIIEELHSLPRSAKKNQLIKLVKNHAQSQSAKPVILWEKRTLTATMIKQFPSAKVQNFKLSKTLFKWLDSIGQASLNQVIDWQKKVYEEDGPQLALLMLMRQIRLLIEIKAGGKPSGAPFMINKLNRQAKNFSLSKLLKIHTALLKIDLQQKTSSTAMSPEQALDLLIIKNV